MMRFKLSLDLLLVTSLSLELFNMVNGCGGRYTKSNGIIKSPNSPHNYPNDVSCTYEVLAVPGHTITLTFLNFTLEHSNDCASDSLKIYEGYVSDGTLVETRCGSNDSSFTSTTDRIFLVFTTDSSIVDSGFSIRYQGCSYHFKNNSGLISSPTFRWPLGNEFCTFLIELPIDGIIAVNFTSYHLMTCCDYLTFFDGVDSTSPLITHMTGINLTNVQSNTNKLYFEFECRGCVSSIRFDASYSNMVPGECDNLNPCQNNGICIESASGYRCNCPHKFTGRNCTIRYVPCNSLPCLNGGVCSNIFGNSHTTFACDCPNGFRGAYCEEAYDECNSYINDTKWQRSINNKLKGSSLSLCDASIKKGWYRFTSKAGSEMPRKCPPSNSCGSTSSIWAIGSLPVLEGTYSNMTACVKNGSICCYRSWQIRVKSCLKHNTRFHLYRLLPTRSCPMAYCAGTEIPCKPGWNSETGFTPHCTDKFPKILSSPVVVPGKVSSKSVLVCKFESDGQDKESIFEVTWYEGPTMRKINHVVILSRNEREAYLEDSHLHLFTLGTTIACRVRSWRPVSPKIKSAYYESNKYFAGVMVIPSKSPISVNENGKTATLTLMVTIPVKCVGLRPCLRIDFKASNSEALIGGCAVEFRTSEANVSKTIEISAKKDFRDDGNQITMVQLQLLNIQNPQHWRNHKELSTLKVDVIDAPTASCTTTNDPRIFTFDNQYFSHLQPGDHLFVKSTARNFEVHVRTKPCSRGTCNCGFATREDNDVIVVDGCEDLENGIPKPRFASKTEPAHGTVLQRDEIGKFFVVKFPSGSTVQTGYFDTSSFDFSNVRVTIPSEDFNSTIGLCGTFDKNFQNDMRSKDGKNHDQGFTHGTAPLAFTESWKFEIGKSLFDYKGEATSCTKRNSKKYCDCSSSALQSCGSGTAAEHTVYQRSTMTNLLSPMTNECNKRKRRSISKGVVLPEADDSVYYVYNPKPLPAVEITWPTPTNKTLADVRTYCNNLLRNSAPGKICELLPDFTFNTYVQQCIDDVQTADDYTFAPASVEAMQDACGEVLIKNISYWEPDPSSNGTTRPPMKMANTMCPGLCRGNGQCINGTCQCNANYTAADCSIDKNKGPSVKKISSNGLCDVRKRKDCHLVKVTGRNFMNSRTLSCQATKLIISSKPYNITDKATAKDANLLSYGEIICDLKTHSVVTTGDARKRKTVPYDGYLIEVSNDGKKFSSKKIPYVIYDSKCMDCNGSTATCSVKVNSCIINGYCFSNGERYPSDPCYTCKPSVSNFQFTPDCVASSDSNIVLITCSVAGGIFITIVLITIVAFKVKLMRKYKLNKGRVHMRSTRNAFENEAYTNSSQLEMRKM